MADCYYHGLTSGNHCAECDYAEATRRDTCSGCGAEVYVATHNCPARGWVK